VRAPGPAQCVPFPVQRLPSARVIWLNDRWFASCGFDIADPTTRAEIVDWLLARFGVISCSPEECEGILTAEMYGTSSGSVHGGAGRAGGCEGFHAKGVGRTPLTGSNTDFHHAHGSLWLYEAVREIVASEVVATELPHGSVPIIALFDTDQDVDVAGATELARRAIIVRPDHVRPGSFERSLYFGSAGTLGSDQVRDAERVRSVVQDAVAGRGRFAGEVFSLDQMIGRIATQLGAGRALRLWQGQFSSANMSIDGAWTDFGAFCALPDWRRAERPLGERFGEEETAFRRTAESIAYFIARTTGQTPRADLSPSRVRAAVKAAFEARIVEELMLDSSAASGPSPVLELVRAYFEHQQRQAVACEDGVPRGWMSSAVDPDSATASADERERQFHREFVAQYIGTGVSAEARRITARRFWRARPGLYQGAADRCFKGYSNPSGYGFTYEPEGIRRFIATRISENRRAWPDRRRGTVVLRQWQNGAESLLQTKDAGGDVGWELVGVERAGIIRFGGASLSLRSLDPWQSDAPTGALHRFQLPADAVAVRGRAVSILGRDAHLAQPMLHWSDPGIAP
jgi:hypothetical protein